MSKALTPRPLGRSGILVPPVIFGTSCLGNLYEELPRETKLEILRRVLEGSPKPAVLDSAGKYGAGLALETLGDCLRELGASPEDVIISNKLGWLRVPLRGTEPGFEPGVWAGLGHDAEQLISAEGILRCHGQGKELLGAPFAPALLSVHDPDEYLAGASSAGERADRLEDIVGAYGSLAALRDRGEAAAIGVGAKDWRVIRDIAERVELDWVMLALSLTVMRHSPELIAFLDGLRARGVGVINSAVFHAGFLTGGRYFDYRVPDPAAPGDRPLFAWRDSFREACARHGVEPAAACVAFGLSHPAVTAVALNTGKPAHVGANLDLVRAEPPAAFWRELKERGLVARDYPHVG